MKKDQLQSFATGVMARLEPEDMPEEFIDPVSLIAALISIFVNCYRFWHPNVLAEDVQSEFTREYIGNPTFYVRYGTHHAKKEARKLKGRLTSAQASKFTKAVLDEITDKKQEQLVVACFKEMPVVQLSEEDVYPPFKESNDDDGNDE